MSIFSSSSKLTLEIGNLNPTQTRLVKTIHALLAHVSSTDNETEYFEGSLELLKMCALVIGEANFPSHSSKETNIPYSKQALELSIDHLIEDINKNRLMTLDN